MVRIKITDAFSIGYVAGKEYDVTPEEAKKLTEASQAVVISPVAPPKKENAAAAGPGKAEKAVAK